MAVTAAVVKAVEVTAAAVMVAVVKVEVVMVAEAMVEVAMVAVMVAVKAVAEMVVAVMVVVMAVVAKGVEVMVVVERVVAVMVVGSEAVVQAEDRVVEVCFGCRNQCNLCRTRSCGRVSQVHRRRRSRRIQNQCTCPDRYHVLLASTLRAGGRRKEGRPAFRVCARTAAEARGGSERERAARRAGILVPVSRTAVAGLGTLMSILFSQDFCTALTRAKARFATISNLVVVGAPAPSASAQLDAPR